MVSFIAVVWQGSQASRSLGPRLSLVLYRDELSVRTPGLRKGHTEILDLGPAYNTTKALVDMHYKYTVLGGILTLEVYVCMADGHQLCYTFRRINPGSIPPIYT